MSDNETAAPAKIADADVTVKVDAKFVKAAYEFAGQHDIRYYLNGVHIRPHPEKGVVIEGTNGHIAGMFHDVNGECSREVIIKLDKACLSAIKKSGKYEVVLGSKMLTVTHMGRNVFIQPGDAIVDGKFPDIQKLLEGKTFTTGLHTLVNFDYVEACRLKAACDSNRYGTCLKLWQEDIGGYKDQHGLILIRHMEVEEFIGLVMPLRDDELSDPIPKWLQ